MPGPNGTRQLVTDYFPAVGTSIGIFRYRNVTYFDAFFSIYTGGDFHHQRRGDPRRLAKTLGVFLRRDHRTEEKCEYYVPDQAGSP